MLTLIVKATEYCNANCVYCAVRDKETKKERMSTALLRTLIERVAEYLAVDPARQVNITWHGGEPALMGTDFYRSVRLLHREILGPNARRLQHTVQSNLTLLDDELAGALAELGVTSVGTSFEWVPDIRGIGPQRDSERYNRMFFEGLEVAKRHGIAAGAIFVVTSRTADKPVETMMLLGNVMGNRLRGHFRINCLYQEGEASRDMNRDLAITPEQFGHFLGQAYQYWYPRRHVLVNVAPFAAVCHAVEGESASLSCEETGVCGDTHLAVSPSGTIFQCGRAMDNDVLRFGNIREKSLDQAFDYPEKQELIQRSAHLAKTECKDCELWDYCHGGCPVDSFIYQEDWRHRTHFCRARKIFLGEYVLPFHEKLRREAAAREPSHDDANAALAG